MNKKPLIVSSLVSLGMIIGIYAIVTDSRTLFLIDVGALIIFVCTLVGLASNE